jgi:phosphoribosyl 1,2-cyclic phosphate phosphodiesterase
LTDANLLFDTPEDVAHSLEREDIHQVSHLLYSHWHPDHTMGRRVLEQLNLNLRKRTKTITDVWLPSWVREDFRKMLGLEDHFQFFEKIGIVRIHEFAEGEAIKLGNAIVKAFRMTQPGLSSYLIQLNGKRVVLALDEIKDWNLGSELLEPDVLVLETGWFEHDKHGEQIIPTGHWIRKSEASFEETLEIVQKMNPGLAIATHIEELNGRSYADYLELEKKYKKNRLHFAYDGLRISL